MQPNRSTKRAFSRRAVWLTAAALFAALGALGLQGLSTVASEAGSAPLAPVAQGPGAPLQPAVGDPTVPGETQAAADYFLKLDGIEGESMVRGHEGEIELQSYSWGAEQTGAHGAGGGGGAGKVSFQDLHFVAKTSKASPKLFLFCANGKHIKEGLITVRKAGGTQQEYLVVKLTDLVVTSYQTGASDGQVPTDQVSINFAKIEYSVRQVMPDGSLGDPAVATWDLKASSGK
jgi:type VI secretion system secreted protein Hcp